jgi:hypothetical protein
MMLLLPCDVLRPRRVDEHFAAEADAARDAGLDVALVDHDALATGRPASPPTPSSPPSPISDTLEPRHGRIPLSDDGARRHRPARQPTAAAAA